MNLRHLLVTSHTSGARSNGSKGVALAAADDLRRIELIVADAVPVWGPHPEGM